MYDGDDRNKESSVKWWPITGLDVGLDMRDMYLRYRNIWVLVIWIFSHGSLTLRSLKGINMAVTSYLFPVLIFLGTLMITTFYWCGW